MKNLEDKDGAKDVEDGWYRIEYIRDPKIWESSKDFVYVKNGYIVFAKDDWGNEIEVKILVNKKLQKYMVIMDFDSRVGYSVGVAGQTVNLLPSGSGGSTPSPTTNFEFDGLGIA